MAIRRVTLKIRIEMAHGKRRYCAPVWEVKGRLKPLFARINGKPEHHPEGVYALRYGDKWEFVGQQTDRVLARKLALEQELEGAANNPVSPKVLSFKQTGITIGEACATHLEDRPDFSEIIRRRQVTVKNHFASLRRMDSELWRRLEVGMAGTDGLNGRMRDVYSPRYEQEC
jgi:hypothetical protein